MFAVACAIACTISIALLRAFTTVFAVAKNTVGGRAAFGDDNWGAGAGLKTVSCFIAGLRARLSIATDASFTVPGYTRRAASVCQRRTHTLPICFSGFKARLLTHASVFTLARNMASWEAADTSIHQETRFTDARIVTITRNITDLSP